MECSGCTLVSRMAPAHLCLEQHHMLTRRPLSFPGGGVPLTQNRTYWSVKGGAIALQPGWFQGHDSATMYVNLGVGTDAPDGGPLNMSLAMVPPFGIVGPSKNPYPGTICLPQVPLPKGLDVKPGDNATIQVVELALHGAALFSVRLCSCSLLWSTDPLADVYFTPAVCRHHLRGHRRPAPGQGQRDQLLQQHRHRLHRHLRHPCQDHQHNGHIGRPERQCAGQVGVQRRRVASAGGRRSVVASMSLLTRFFFFFFFW